MSRMTVLEVSSWGIEYPVNGDYLSTALVNHARGTLWSRF
jgi:hypothetical protein